MRIGWYVTQRGKGARPWVLEKRTWNGGTIRYRKNGNVYCSRNKEAAQRLANELNREEAVS